MYKRQAFNINTLKRLNLLDKECINQIVSLRKIRNVRIHDIEIPEADYINRQGDEAQSLFHKLSEQFLSLIHIYKGHAVTGAMVFGCLPSCQYQKWIILVAGSPSAASYDLGAVAQGGSLEIALHCVASVKLNQIVFLSLIHI